MQKRQVYDLAGSGSVMSFKPRNGRLLRFFIAEIASGRRYRHDNGRVQPQSLLIQLIDDHLRRLRACAGFTQFGDDRVELRNHRVPGSLIIH